MKYLAVIKTETPIGGRELNIPFGADNDALASADAKTLLNVMWHDPESTVRLFRLVEVDIVSKEISNIELANNELERG